MTAQIDTTTMTKRLPPLSRRRPKRQRNPTTLYTDDNPSTFTVKRKKGEYVDSDESPLPAPQEKPKPSFYFVEESLPMKRSYRKKKPTEKAAANMPLSSSARVVSNEVAAVPPIAGTLDPNAPPVKRKRGRPPSKKTLMERQLAAKRAAAAAPSVATTVIQQEPESPKPVKPAPAPAPTKRPSSKAAVSAISWTPAVHDSIGTFIPHSLAVAPILPPTQHDKNPRHNNDRKYPIVFGDGLGATTPLNEPKWTPLHCPDVYFEDDYDSDENRRLDASVLPVTRTITCVTTRKPDNQYMAVGDTAGFCIIYSMGPHIRPVARLETVACQQRAREEQEKIREQKQRKKGKLRSLVMDESQTTIHALAMIGTRVVLATACELECMDVPSQTSLWVCPLSSNRLVTSLDMHMSTYDVLVSCSLYQQSSSSDQPRNAATSMATSPLMLLQHSENNVEICDANSPILLKSPCCTAMWDASTTSVSRLLFVAVSDTENELELVLVQGGSIDSWKVACKTRIPVKASNHQTRLCQSPKGLYTLVASSRGIRLYQTETLQLINVYGDNLALHGKSVVWQDCLLLGQQNGFPIPDKATNKNLEYGDWLQSEENKTEKEANDESELGLYIIGVPNFKGPRELCETLHVWRTEQASTVPALSIPLPPKSEGVQGLVPAPPIVGGDRIVLSTGNGQGHVLLPRVQSNFAGIMYPAGYNVINDNLDYIEDEDDLDEVEVARKEPEADEEEEEEEEDVDVLIPEDEEMDEDLKEALRQSLLEQKRQKERESVQDASIDVLSHISDETDELLIPCRPEPYLKQAVNSSNDFADTDGDAEQEQEIQHDTLGEQPKDLVNLRPLFISKNLETMPNMHKKQPSSSNELGFTVTAKIAVVTNPIPNRPGRGKRKAANLETMLKSSIDPHLQRFMISKQGVWSDGSGARQTERHDYTVDDQARTSQIAEDQNPSAITPSTAISKSVDMLVVRQEGSAVFYDKNGKVGEEIACENGNTGLTAAKLLNGSYMVGKTDIARSLSVRPDEAAVALGLLGLSPCHNNAPSESGGSEGPVSERVYQPILPSGATDESSGGSSDASVEKPSLPPNAFGAHSNAQILNHVVYQTAGSSLADTSDRGSVTADAISEIALSYEASRQKSLNCCACRGRQVIHTCGKRSLPIDFDEVAKAERERKAKEEEEKKKIRAEKRRQADARRREAKKQKQLEIQKQLEAEERRKRQEKEAQLLREKLLAKREQAKSNGGILGISTTATATAADPEQHRREMIVASYVDYPSAHSASNVTQ